MWRWRRRLPGGLGAAVCGLTAMMVALALLPAVASASPTQKPSLQIGPLQAAGGYTFDLQVGACTGASSDVTILYTRGGAADDLAYSYAGVGDCTAAADLGHVRLRVRWPGVATIDLTAPGAGARARLRRFPGCRGGRGITRISVLRGSIAVTAARAFGSLRSRSVRADVSRISGERCPGLHEGQASNLFARFGSNASLFASVQTQQLPGSVLISDTFTPAAGVSGSMSLALEASKQTYDLNKGVAVLGHLGPFATGGLTLTALPRCPGASAGSHNVSLAGAVTIHSAVLGTIVLGPATASRAYLAPPSGFPGQCDGYGSIPLSAGVDSACDDPTAPCSASFGENTVTFFDTSSPGTQKVLSETLTPGDGSPAIPMTDDDSATHTYPGPGTYVATETIQTSDGNTEVATTTVYVAS